MISSINSAAVRKSEPGGTKTGFEKAEPSLQRLLYTAILRKVVGKVCTPQSRKAIWDMLNTLFLTTVAVEPTFVAFH